MNGAVRNKIVNKIIWKEFIAIGMHQFAY